MKEENKMGKFIITGVYALGLWFSYSIGKRGFARTLVEIEDTIDGVRKWGIQKLHDLGEERENIKQEKSDIREEKSGE
jgi:hypothetical protein